MEADKRIWALLSEFTRRNVASKLGSPPPCDREFAKLAESQEILSFLAPLPLPPPVPEFTRPCCGTVSRSQKKKGKGKGKGKEPSKGGNPVALDFPKE